MQDMQVTNSVEHKLDVSTNPGISYNYYFACSDGLNTMSNSHYQTFSVSAAPSDGGGNTGGGGGGRRRNLEGPVNTQPVINNPQNRPTVQNPPQQPEEIKETPKQEQNTNQASNQEQKKTSPLTGFVTFVNNAKKYKKPSLAAGSVILVSLLAGYGFTRYRRYKLSKMHRPPFDSM